MIRKHFSKLLVLGLAFAAQAALASIDSPLPPAADINGIRVLSGGITLDESTAIKRQASRYRLSLVLAGRGGAYQVADELQILKGNQTLIRLVDAGPWVLADLPPGNYRLVATVSGQRLEKSLVLGRSPARVHWITPPQLD